MSMTTPADDKIDTAIRDAMRPYVDEGVEIGLEVASTILRDLSDLRQTVLVLELRERAEKRIADLRRERGL